MPPWIWMFSAAAWKYASEQYALASAATDGQLVVVLGRGPAGVVRGRLGRLDLEQHVGALVLDRLERADRPAELHADLGVLDRHLEHLLRAADLLGGQRDRGQVEGAVQRRGAVAGRADQPAGHAGELEPGLLAGLVHRRQRGAGQPGRVALHREQRKPASVVRGDQDQVGGGAVEHEHLVPVQPPGLTVLDRGSRIAAGSQEPPSSVKASVAMVSPEAMPGSSPRRAPSSGLASRVVAASTTLARYGARTARRRSPPARRPARRSCSRRRRNSSGMARPCRPSCCPSAPRRPSRSRRRPSARAPGTSGPGPPGSA